MSNQARPNDTGTRWGCSHAPLSPEKPSATPCAALSIAKVAAGFGGVRGDDGAGAAAGLSAPLVVGPVGRSGAAIVPAPVAGHTDPLDGGGGGGKSVSNVDGVGLTEKSSSDADFLAERPGEAARCGGTDSSITTVCCAAPHARRHARRRGRGTSSRRRFAARGSHSAPTPRSLTTLNSTGISPLSSTLPLHTGYVSGHVWSRRPRAGAQQPSSSLEPHSTIESPHWVSTVTSNAQRVDDDTGEAGAGAEAVREDEAPDSERRV